MRGGVFVCVALLVALVSASPLDRAKDESTPLKVVDVPAGIFENPEETQSDVTTLEEGESPKVEETPIASVDEKKVLEASTADAEEIKPVKEVGETEDEEQAPHIFGFRLPTVVVFRRPAIFRDPFAGFQSPFFSSRPSLFSGASDEEKDAEPVVIKDEDQKEDESGSKVTVVNMDDVMRRMHQQINNLWTNLFNADNFYLPRPTFSRPSFFNPSLTGMGSDEEDKVDFDKLPANYSNSTSETKIVDGHTVTVNKTIHKVSNNNSNGIFHFSVIKIHNSHPEEAVEKTPSSPGPVVIGVENINNPEISETQSVTTIKNAEVDPTLNEVDRVDDANKESKLPEVELNNKYEIENDKSPDSQQQMTDEQILIVPIKSEKLIKAPTYSTKRGADLSSDIRVNNLMESGDSSRLRALYDPDEVEIFEV